MKTIKKQFKSVALILSMLILLQGCTVYKSVPLSLEQAAKGENRVKVKTKSGENFKFNRIGFEDGNYYGVKKSNGEIIRTPLDHDFINRINEKDKTLSTILTVAIPVVIIAGVLTLVVVKAYDNAGFGTFL